MKTILKLSLSLLIAFMINNVSLATVYYSQGNVSNSFADLTNWNSASDGSGSNPLLADLTSGLHSFLIKDGHTVSIDLDVDVASLIVGQGGATSVLDIDGASARSITVRSSIYVDSNGDFRPSNTTTVHSITLLGTTTTITNLGIFRPRRDGDSYANVIVSSTGSINIAGTSQIWFYDLTINGGGTVTSSGTIYCFNNFLLAGNSSLIGSANIYNRGAVTVDVGSTINLSNGAFIIDENVDQTLTCNGTCDFYNLYLDNRSNTTDMIKTVIGDVTVKQRLYVYSDAVFAGSGSVTLKDNLDIRNPNGWVGSGDIIFDDPLDGGYINTVGTTVTLGTSRLIIDAYISLSDNSTAILLNNDLTITDGNRLVLSFSSSMQQAAGPANTLTLGASSLLYARGIDNFPAGFANYTLDETSRTIYDGTFFINNVKGGINYGDLVLSNGTKNNTGGAIIVNGNLTVNNATIFSLINPGDDLTLKGNVNGNGGTLSSTQTVTIAGIDKNQTLDPDVAYDLNNLVITNPGPITDIRTKNIRNDISLSGDLTITNTGGNASNYMIVDINDYDVNSTGAGTLTINDNVEFRTGGTTAFDDMVDVTAPSFAVVTISDNSVINFDGGTTQEIPGLTYGNIYLDNGTTKTLTGDITINGNMDGNRDNYDLIDAGHTITLYGNWDMGDFGNGQNRTVFTGDFIFAGADQTSKESNFNNVTFAGTGTKTMTYTINVACTMTIEDGVTFTSDYNIEVGCDLNVNGTGILRHNNRIFTFDGVVDQGITINNPATSFLNDVSLTNNGNVITLNSDLDVNGYLTMNNGNAVTLNIDDDSLFILGDFLMYAEDNLSTVNGTLIFDGNADQVIRNGNATTTYNNMFFRTGGEKRFATNTLDINGDVVGDPSVTLNQNNIRLNVAGDWTHLGSIAGGTGNSIYFDGVTQTITGSEFNTVYFGAAGGVSLLGANTYIKGDLYIENGGTLDVDAVDNNRITIEGSWVNDFGGVFESRNGRVTFVGAGSNIYTGGTGAGKAFYDLYVGLSSSGASVTVQDRNPDAVDAGVDLDIDGRLNIYRGRLNPSARNVYVGGDFTVPSSNGRFLGTNGNHTLYFDGPAGVKSWSPNTQDFYREVVFDALGATWELGADVSISSGENFIINNGKFDLNSYDLTFSGNNSDININGVNAELEIDAGAVLTMGTNTNCDLNNNGGTLTLVGTMGNIARIKSASTFNFNQTGATSVIAANYYSISGTRGNGVDITDGIIDGTNNFSNGSFSGGVGTAYLTIHSGAFATDTTIRKVTFTESSNGVPTYNASHTSGTVITFEDAKGNAVGPSRENDDLNAATGFIRWNYTEGFFWTNGGGDSNWDNPLNWSTGVLPISTSQVILDHTTVAGAYTVNINTAINGIDATTASLDILDGASGKITLDLNGKSLRVAEDVSIGSLNEIEQSSSTDTLFVAGSFSNTSGIYDAGTATLIFDGESGDYTISTNSSGQVNRNFHNVIFRGGASYSLVDPLEVQGDLLITGSSLNLGDVGNTLHLLGDFIVSDSGAFVHANAETRFSGTSGTQVIDFGGQKAFDLDFRNASQKQIVANLSVERNMNLQATTGTVDAGENFIFIQGSWRNLKGLTGFTQTGGGTVAFNGINNQNIGNGGDPSTQFNNVLLQSLGTKQVNIDLSMTGDLQILLGANNVSFYINAGYSIDGVGANNRLIMQEGYFRLRNASGFPTGFEDVDLLGGEVFYETTGIDQDVYGTSYYNLRYWNNGGGTNDKNVLGDIVVRNRLYTPNNPNAQLNMNCFDLTIEGSMNIGNNTPQIDWGSACITTCGTGGTLVLGENIGSIDPQLSSFHNIRVENGGNVILDLTSDLTLDGNLEVSDGSFFDMNGFTVENTCVDVSNLTSFTLSDNANLRTQVATPSIAIPSNFGTYFISNTSTVEYERAGDQDIFTNGGTVLYGNLLLQGSGVKSLDGELFVEGDFDMDGNTTSLIDNGNDMTFSGQLNTFNNYTATDGVLVKFEGDDQTIRIDDNTNVVTFDDVEFSGDGTKLFWDGETYNFLGDFKVSENVVIDFSTYRQNISFSGDSILVAGTLTNDEGNYLFRFNKNGEQIVDFGSNHDINHLEVKTNAQVKIINNGLNITGNGGSQNFLEVEAGASLDLDTLTHFIGQDLFIIDGTLNAANADLVFNQDGPQNIDGFEAMNVLFTGSSNKVMEGTWRMNDVTIDGSVNIDFLSQDTMVVRGSYTSNGTLNRRTNTVVRFEIDDTDPRTIQTNNEIFAQVKFVQIGSNEATYTLLDDLNIDDSLRIGTGATLDINGNSLYIGTTPDNGAATEYLVIETGGELQVDEGASLLFECNANDPVMDVFGTLTVIGSTSENAVVSRYNGNNEIDINIIGGTISARYYSFSNLVDAGLFVDENSTIDPVNNFSDGSFSSMQQGVGAVYLHIEADVSGINDIGNISFSNTNPVVGNDFNVRRNRLDGGIITFVENVGGALAGFEYEDEAVAPALDGRIIWPVNDITNWVGGDGTDVNDWFLPGNWDNGVPDITKSAVIGSRPFLPIIKAGGADTAFAKNLSLVANAVSLNIRDGIDLKVLGEVQLGTGNLSTSIIVEDPASDILVGGNWFVTANSFFTNGGAKVEFLGLSSPVSITHDDQSFHDLVFSGSATFNIVGDLQIDGDVSITSGTVSPSTNGYEYFVAGDWNETGGLFTTATNGTVEFNGVNQVITNAIFDNLTISSSGCANVSGTLRVNDELIVNGCLEALAGSTIDMNDDVTINVAGSFDDGGESHTFSGINWTGTGAFPLNTGTIVFDRSGGTQNIFASKFNKMSFVGSSRIELEGAVSVTGDVNITNSINRFYTQQNEMTNTTGVGTFTLEDNEFIYVDGANNFPAGFATYSIGENSYTYYDGTSDQTILGGISYGNLYLQGLSTKTIALGDIGIQRDLNITDATLDVSPNNYDISIARNWNNAAAGSFIARKGKVLFNGTGAQAINAGDHPLDGNKKFWDLEVANSSAASNVDVNGGDIYVDSTLSVTNGIFTLVGVGNGFTAFVGGSLEASGTGVFATAGIYELTSSVNSSLTDDLVIRGNGSIFADLKINSAPTTVYNFTSDLIVNGDFNLVEGEVNLNGFTASLGTNIDDAVTISGDLVMDAGSELLLGNQTSLTVTAAGSFDIIGELSNPATVTRRYNTGDYNFIINGSVSAQFYAFRYMSTQGVVVNNTATIDNVNNFSNGTFSNPSTAGVCLRIENTQKFTTSNGRRIENVSFPTNPGLGTFNVAKTVSLSDSIEFYNATGSLSGETYENDPNDLIVWTGPRKMIWTGNKNTDWFDVANWSATSGPTQVPDSSLDATIPFVTNQPIINVTGAKCQKLTIEASAIVIVSTPDNTGSDLVVFDDLLIEGIIRTNTANDILEVRGDWSRVDGGIYTYGSAGKVILSSTAGTLTLDNGSSPFYDLDIDATGNIVLLGTDIVIDNDISILNGTLDVSNSGFDISVEGDFVNSSIFRPRTGTVDFTTSSTSNLDGSMTDFYNLKMSGNGTLLATSDIQVDNITTVESGTIDLNGNTWFVGDASGSDLLRVTGGIFDAGAGSFIRVADGGGVIVSGSGLFKLVGDDISNRAIINNQSGSSKYSFTVANGGTLEAKFYTFRNLDASGLNFQLGSLLDLTNNLSYGTFTQGTSGGTYITFSNAQDLKGNDQIEYVSFPSNPGGGASNVRKTNAAGEVKFYFAIGDFQGEDFDNDPSNLIEWDADLIWTGLGGSSSWTDPANWTPQLEVSIAGLIPTTITDVVIPDAATTPFDPILTVDGLADDLLIETAGLLTINSNADLAVEDSVIINGTLTIGNASNTDLTLGGSWVSTSGTFNSGNNSEIIFTNSAGVESISSNDPFCGIRINSSSPSNGTIETGTLLDINCDLRIDAGTFRIADPSHIINLSGNWLNSRSAENTGFDAGTGTVVFDGGSDQNISQTGNSETFYNLTVSNSGGAELNLLNNIVIENNLTIDDNSLLDNTTRRIIINGDWINNNTVAAAGFNPTAGVVRFEGASTQTVSHAGGNQLFNAVVIANTSAGTAILLNSNMTIKGNITQSDGIVTTGVNRFTLQNTDASGYSGWSDTAFVNGNLRRFVASNTSTYEFPIGKGTSSSDYYRIDMLNNNMTGLNYIDGSVASITESGNNIDGNVDLEEYNGGATYLAVTGEQAIWTLVPDAPIGTGDYGIRAYIANIAGLSDNLFGLVKRPTGSIDYADWTDDGANTTIPDTGLVGRTIAGGYAERLGWTGFSQFAIATTDIPLPIELLSFDVEAVGSTVVVNWVTLTEKNNDYFTIERSVDGVNFTPVGKVFSEGNSLNEVAYSFTDSKALTGVSYYRLTQTDFDGRSETFEIRAVSVESGGFSNIYPNPTSGEVYVSSAKNDIKSISIYSLLGELVLTKTLNGENVKLDVSNLASGIYTVVTRGINWVEKEALVLTK